MSKILRLPALWLLSFFQVWDVAEGNPVCVHTHDSIDAGAIFCAAFAPDEPFYIAAGGAKGKVNHHHHHHMCRHELHSANLTKLVHN